MSELHHAVENLLAVIDREYGPRQLPWMEGARRRVEEAMAAPAPSPSSPRLDSPEVREALEAGAEALEHVATGYNLHTKTGFAHARTLRAMADGVASDADARDAGRWVAWKPGDALPASPGWYWLTVHPHWASKPYNERTEIWADADDEGKKCMAAGWRNRNVIAYWSLPVPPPYEPYTPPSTAEKGE